RVVQTMNRDLRLGVRIVGCPTVRDPDGLALSSRNGHLTADERRSALALSRGLFAGRDLWTAGERDPAKLRLAVERIAAGPGVALEYVSVADPYTLEELRGERLRGVRVQHRLGARERAVGHPRRPRRLADGHRRWPSAHGRGERRADHGRVVLAAALLPSAHGRGLRLVPRTGGGAHRAHLRRAAA